MVNWLNTLWLKLMHHKSTKAFVTGPIILSVQRKVSTKSYISVIFFMDQMFICVSGFSLKLITVLKLVLLSLTTNYWLKKVLDSIFIRPMEILIGSISCECACVCVYVWFFESFGYQSLDIILPGFSRYFGCITFIIYICYLTLCSHFLTCAPGNNTDESGWKSKEESKGVC